MLLQNKKKCLPLQRNWETTSVVIIVGEVAEWSIAAVLKTVVLRGTGGSNPSLSAESKTKDFTKAFKKSFKAPYISWLRCFFIFAPQQGEGLNVGFSLQSSVIICYIYCYTLKTPQKNVAVTIAKTKCDAFPKRFVWFWDLLTQNEMCFLDDFKYDLNSIKRELN